MNSHEVMYIYLADFLKTSLTKSAVISVKGCQKVVFFGPNKLQNHTHDEKERRKRKSKGEERRRREKSNGCTLSFYNGYFPFGGNVFILKNDTLIKKNYQKFAAVR